MSDSGPSLPFTRQRNSESFLRSPHFSFYDGKNNSHNGISQKIRNVSSKTQSGSSTSINIHNRSIPNPPTDKVYQSPRKKKFWVSPVKSTSYNRTSRSTDIASIQSNDNKSVGNNHRERWKSQALYFEVRLTQLRKMKDSDSPSEWVARKTLELLNELGDTFPFLGNAIEMFHNEFSNAIYTNKFTTLETEDSFGENQLRKVTYFEKYQEWEEMRQAEKNRMDIESGFSITKKNERKIEELSALQEQTKKQNLKLQYEKEDYEKKIEDIQSELYSHQKASESRIQKLSQSIYQLKEEKEFLSEQLSDLKGLKNEKEALTRDYLDLKQKKKYEGSVMYSSAQQILDCNSFQKQFEALENIQISQFERDSLRQGLAGSKLNTTGYALTSSFVNNVKTLVEEQSLIDELKFQVTRNLQKETGEKLVKKRAALERELAYPLRDESFEKFFIFLDIYGTSSTSPKDTNLKWKFIGRTSIKEESKPKIFSVPNGIKHVKIICSRIESNIPHPNLESPTSDEIIAESKSKSQFSPDVYSLLWKEFIRRYDSQRPFTPRAAEYLPRSSHLTRKNISLPYIRHLIYLTYNRFFYYRDHSSPVFQDYFGLTDENNNMSVSDRILLFEGVKGKRVPIQQEILFEVLKEKYILDEIVMKVSYEILQAIDSFESEQSDIEQFFKFLCTEADSSSGSIAFIAAHHITSRWFKILNYDRENHIDKKLEMEEFSIKLREFYETNSESDFESIVQIIAEETNQELTINKVLNYFFKAIKEGSEYWISMYSNLLQQHMNQSMYNVDDFLLIRKLFWPQIPEDEAKNRFFEATSVINAKDKVLMNHHVAYILAEYKWRDINEKLRTKGK